MGCKYADMQLQGSISLKSCGYAVAKVLPSNCRGAIANNKKFITVPTSGIYT
jgi:hypothetical protein